MNIALIGYGKMGRTIAEVAKKRGHNISLIIDVDNLADFNIENISKCDVAIEFTRPDVAFDNVVKCLQMNIPIVSGSTGWVDKYEQAKEVCVKNNGSFIWSSNYSIGVNIFMQINKTLASLMNTFPDYNVEMTEVHHIHKLDKPSGTAITLAEQVIAEYSGKTKWELDNQSTPNDLKITSIREGEVPGKHVIHWYSLEDEITISHNAFGRQGLALGAVLSAEFIHDKKGVFTMNDILKIK